MSTLDEPSFSSADLLGAPKIQVESCQSFVSSLLHLLFDTTPHFAASGEQWHSGQPRWILCRSLQGLTHRRRARGRECCEGFRDFPVDQENPLVGLA